MTTLAVVVATAMAGAMLLPGRMAMACTSSAGAVDDATIARNAPDAFGWFDTAASVAAGKVTRSPAFTPEGHGLAGEVVFGLETTLKGTPPKNATVKQPMTPCGGYSSGTRRIVFLDATGTVLGAAPIELEKALARYAACESGAARAQLLKTFASGKAPLIAGAARRRLHAK